MATMKTSPSIEKCVAGEPLWEAYRAACFKYWNDRTATNWLAKQEAYNAWSKAFLK